MEQCVFCLEDMNDESETMILECKHKMHTSCFMEYVKYNMNKQSDIICPLCRDVVINMNTISNIHAANSCPHAVHVTPIPQEIPVIHAIPVTYIEQQTRVKRCFSSCFVAVIIGINLIILLTMKADT